MKRLGWVSCVLMVGFCLAMYGCSGGDGGSEELAADISDETDLVDGDGGPTSRVEVGVLHHPELVNGMFPFVGEAGQARIFENILGQEIRLERAEVWFESVHLVPCNGGEEVALVFNQPDDYIAYADVTAVTQTYDVPD